LDKRSGLKKIWTRRLLWCFEIEVVCPGRRRLTASVTMNVDGVYIDLSQTTDGAAALHASPAPAVCDAALRRAVETAAHCAVVKAAHSAVMPRCAEP